MANWQEVSLFLISLSLPISYRLSAFGYHLYPIPRNTESEQTPIFKYTLIRVMIKRNAVDIHCLLDFSSAWSAR